jgi:diaminopimelate epimerase
MLPFSKAHAYGNDFLYVRAADLKEREYGPAAIRLCDRHTGIGADGLIIYKPTERGASMTLHNADGGKAELSGNGLRALAALIVRDRLRQGRDGRSSVEIETAAGVRTLQLTSIDGPRYVFEAEMGHPGGLRQATLSAGGESVTATVLTMGNPQLVVLGPLPSDERFARLGPALERHAEFPAGTNVEFAHVESPGNVEWVRLNPRGPARAPRPWPPRPTAAPLVESRWSHPAAVRSSTGPTTVCGSPGGPRSSATGRSRRPCRRRT